MFLPLAADLLGESRGDDLRRLDAHGAAFFQRVGHEGGGDNQHGQIHHFRQVGHRPIGFQPHHLVMAAADRIDIALVGMAAQHIHDAAAQNVGVGRSADDRDARRRKKGADVGHIRWNRLYRSSAARDRGR